MDGDIQLSGGPIFATLYKLQRFSNCSQTTNRENILTFKFIHTADWQLGAPFGGFTSDLAGELKAARRNVVQAIANVANDQGAFHVIVAGDVWDSETPSEATLAQPLDRMGEASVISWWLMPGNHDLVRKNMLWDRIEARKPDNVHLLLEQKPVQAEPGVWLLPGPWDSKQPGRDLTAWMTGADTPEGDIRVGVGHGSVTDFSSESGDRSVIERNRAKQARLDYLALGDWHGMKQVNSRTWYSGTPEPDRHRRNEPGYVLAVSIDSAGVAPNVQPITTATFAWPIVDADLRSQEDFAGLETIVIGKERPDRRLVRLNLTGRLTMTERQDLNKLLEGLGPRLAYLDIRDSDLEVRVEVDDLDTLDHQGSVRIAAEALLERKQNSDLSRADRDTAGRALDLLFTFAASVESGAV